MKEELGLPTAEAIYYEKGLCLVSKQKYTDEFGQCLKHLYRLSMSKNDIPFHEVIASFVNGLRMPKELGINGMSYSYGGSNITFETNPTYPIVSVRVKLLRKEQSIVYSSSCLSRPSYLFSKPSSQRKKLSLFHSQKLYSDMLSKLSYRLSSPLGGNMS